jgi:poly-gamma-glutamate synthase PgsB/CapB
MEETARQVIEDLTSRGALSGAASLAMLAGVLFGWLAWTSGIARRRRDIPISILITGSRGKSSTVRLIHAALEEAGFHPYGKITGTEANELETDGTEKPTFRLGAPSVLETLTSMARAFKGNPPADALVFECMAVSPDLIELVSSRMVDPNIVVITNIQLDHLEEEGSSPEEIARSLANAIRPRSLVITGEDDPGAFGVVIDRATELDARLVSPAGDDIDPGILERLEWAHPQNVALTLEVTRSLGIEDGIAVAGMLRSTREPGEQEIWGKRLKGLEATYADLGAINDPESLQGALDSFEWPTAPGVPRIALLSGRWDRPLRALEFAGFLDPGMFDGLILAGGPVRDVRSTLIEGGWLPDRVVVAPRLNEVVQVWKGCVHALARRIDPEADQVMIISLENEHDALAESARRFFHHGTQLNGSTREASADVA